MDVDTVSEWLARIAVLLVFALLFIDWEHMLTSWGL
jgi:hypothetical protein